MSPPCDAIQPQTVFIIPALYNLNSPSRFGEKSNPCRISANFGKRSRLEQVNDASDSGPALRFARAPVPGGGPRVI